MQGAFLQSIAIVGDIFAGCWIVSFAIYSWWDRLSEL
jgi:hypothetical protein